MRKWFAALSMSLSRRFSAIMALFLALILLGGLVVIWIGNATLQKYENEVEATTLKLNLVNDIERDTNQIFFRVRGYYSFQDSKEYDAVFQEQAKLEQALAEFLQLPLNEEERTMAKEVSSFFQAYFKNTFPTAVSYVKANDYASLRALSASGVNNSVNKLIAYAANFRSSSQDFLQQENKRLMSELSYSSLFFIAYIGFVLLIAYLVNNRTVKNIGKPLTELTLTAERFAKGEAVDTHANSHAMRRKDEIGQLSRSFHSMFVEISAKEEELQAQNEELQAQQEELQMQQEELQAALTQREENERYLERRNRLVLSLSNTLDKNELLQSIIRTIVEVMGADKGMIVLMDADRSHAAFGISDRLARAGVEHLEDGLFGRVLETKQPYVHVRYAEGYEQGYHADAFKVYDLLAPVMNGQDEAAACILLTRMGRPITPLEETEIAGIARQISLALEKLAIYEQSEAQRKLTQDMLNTIQEGIHLLDREGVTVQVNRKMAQMWSLDAGSIMAGSPLESCFAHLSHVTKDSRTLQQYIADCLHHRDMQAKSLIYEVESPVHRFFQVYHEPLYRGENRLGTLFVHRDITTEYEVDQMKSEFVSTVSHELRTPLASVLGFTELLLSKELSPERQRKYLTTIQQEAQRLTGLINDFLDLQRMESGKQNYSFEALDLLPQIEQVIDLQQANPELYRFELDTQTPQTVIWADPDKIRQVFTNLINNAVKYSPNGGTIRISFQELAGQLQVDITDQGLGIPEEALSKLFSKFYRIDNSDRRQIGGTGLGLAIVKEIAAAHEGDVSVSSVYGQGSTFSVKLPLYVPPAPVEPTPPSAVSLDEESLTGTRVLIVEDDASLTELLREELQEQGFRVFPYANGETALRAMAEIQPDVVVIDIVLKDSIDGWTIIETMMKDERLARIPIFISSAFEEKEKGIEIGATGYLIKPYHPEMLSRAILQTIADRKSKNEESQDPGKK